MIINRNDLDIRKVHDFLVGKGVKLYGVSSDGRVTIVHLYDDEEIDVEELISKEFPSKIDKLEEILKNTIRKLGV